MLKIGEFSVLSMISISKLRNYDKQGLLVPVHVDEENGYRYYDKNQLVDANRIVSLKSMGFGLSEIHTILHMNNEQKNEILKEKLNQKKQELRLLIDQIHRIEETSSLKDAEENYALSIVEKTMPAMSVISYRNIIEKFNQEGVLWQKLNELCEKYQLRVRDNAYSMAIQHSFDLEKNYVDVEVMLSTDEIYENVAPLTSYEIPQREVASLIFQGSYNQITKINSFIAKWMEQNEYEIIDQPFSIYHMSPRECKEEMEFVTEICFPIAKK